MLKLIQTVIAGLCAACSRRTLPPLPALTCSNEEVPNLILNWRYGLHSSTRFAEPLGRVIHPPIPRHLRITHSP